MWFSKFEFRITEGDDKPRYLVSEASKLLHTQLYMWVNGKREFRLLWNFVRFSDLEYLSYDSIVKVLSLVHVWL